MVDSVTYVYSSLGITKRKIEKIAHVQMFAFVNLKFTSSDFRNRMTRR
jgi:hypothetical protein